jgi:hypothetical protein
MDSDSRKLPSEIEELDLLSKQVTPSPDDTLGLKLSALSARMQKRFEEHKEAENRSELDARQRHLLLLQALLKVRKILKGVSALDIGAGVELKLVCDDFQGWPRVQIVPKRVDDPALEYPSFEVTGHDRGGVAQLELNSTVIREHHLLLKDEDLERLPRVMKRVIRFYLDSLVEEILSVSKRPKEEELKPVEAEPVSQAFVGVDLFEDALGEDFLEKLPELEQLEKL